MLLIDTLLAVYQTVGSYKLADAPSLGDAATRRVKAVAVEYLRNAGQAGLLGQVFQQRLNEVGGLVGQNFEGSVTQCHSTGAVSGTGNYVGGLVGSGWEGDVIYSFWDIQTSGQAKSAGGTGKTTAEMRMVKTFLDAGWRVLSSVEGVLRDGFTSRCCV